MYFFNYVFKCSFVLVTVSILCLMQQDVIFWTFTDCSIVSATIKTANYSNLELNGSYLLFVSSFSMVFFYL